MSDYQRHLLVMLEAAQKAGRTEREIVQLVEDQIHVDPGGVGVAEEHRLVRRLWRRDRTPKAA